MTGILFTNFARSQLASSLLAGDLALTVETTHGARFPNPGAGEYFYLVLENASLVREVVKVTARAGDTMTIVRGQDNTTAVAWNAGDIVELRMVAAALKDAIDAVAGAGYASLAGAAFTGAVSMDALLTADGGVEVPAGQTGNNARRASELVLKEGGAARMPSWTTAGRPASPEVGDTGLNTTLGCNETWNGTDWVQDGIVESAVVATTSGTGHEIAGIPAWPKRVVMHLVNVSTTGSQYVLARIGNTTLATSGYLGTTIDINGALETTSTSGMPMRMASATNVITGTIEIVREPGTFNYKMTSVLRRVDTAGGGMISHALVTLTGAVDRVGLARQGTDTFDGGKFWVTWE